ncbi:MAG: hypothetical protein IJ223_04435 [Clostridia bacterium]|nr:hypothetical protein [Clostridia bacterium]
MIKNVYVNNIKDFNKNYIEYLIKLKALCFLRNKEIINTDEFNNVKCAIKKFVH